jgi:type II secretory pathway component PulJ
MQQTLLAFLALLIATLLSFSQQQSSVQNQRQVVRAELQQMALGVAMQTMEMVRARAFDAAVKGGSSNPSNFTAEANFGDVSACRPVVSARNDSPACDTIEDFHVCQVGSCENDLPGNSYSTDFELPGGDRFPFDVAVTVRYVDSDFQPTSGPQAQKQVIVWVQDENDRLARPIRYSEVIAYP